VLNGDVLNDMDLTAQVARHEAAGAAATLALIAVDDTSSYGVVPTAADGRVEAFLEKSDGPAPTNRINAGAYVLERDVVESIAPGRAVSFELEVFPALVEEGRLFGHPAEGYWIDVGTPERYLEATYDLLSGRVESSLAPRDETGSLIYAGGITAGARIGPASVVGRHCSVGPDSRVERSVLHDSVRVGGECVLTDCIVGEGAEIGDEATVEPGAVIGSHAAVPAGAVIGSGARISPGESVPAGALDGTEGPA